LRNACDEAAGKNQTVGKYKSDYFTGMGIRPEDIWGHELFDSAFDDMEIDPVGNGYLGEGIQNLLPAPTPAEMPHISRIMLENALMFECGPKVGPKIWTKI